MVSIRDVVVHTGVDPTLPAHLTTKNYVDLALAAKVSTSRQILAGNGLTGGGDLSADRTLAVSFGTTPVSVAAAAAAGTGTTVARIDHVHPGVDLTSNETIAGIKTFSSSPIVPTPTTSGQAATKGYVDSVTPAAWTTFTPTWTMATLAGNGHGRYLRIGPLCLVEVDYVAASGVSLGTGHITFTLPFTVASIGNQICSANGVWVNAGVKTQHVDVVAFSGGTTAEVFAVNSTDQKLITPGTAGYTFVAGDSITANFWFPV